MANSIVFLHWNDVQDLMGVGGNASYVLVVAGSGHDPAVLTARIKDQIDDVEVLETATFVENDRVLALQMGGDLIAFMTVIGGVIGALVIGWTVFAFVARKKRELAVAKALGAGNGEVLVAVAFQAVVLTGLGYGLALLSAIPVEKLVAELVPEVAIVFSGSSLIRLGVVAFVIAVLSALVPAKRVTDVDPAKVFSL